MKIYREIDKLPSFKNAILTIGSFDGVHPGHRHVIDQMKKLAEDCHGETVLITFDPHPRIALAQQIGKVSDLVLINDIEEKAYLLEKNGIDHLVIIPFSKDFSEQSPESYLEDFIIKNFHPSKIVIGYDHRFGKGRVGDIDFLKKYQDKFNYQVIEISKQEVDGISVSSTKIRQALMGGNVHLASKLLGYHYTLSGIVVKGNQIGRELGFPTANLKIDDPYKLIPGDGIYAVLVNIDQTVHKGMLYIGSRPTLDSNLEKTIEVNIFNFSSDIYDDKVKIEFIEHLRSDEKFNGYEALKSQLQMDKEMAIKALSVYHI